MPENLAAMLRRRFLIGMLAAAALTALIGALVLFLLQQSFFEVRARVAVGQDTDLPAALALLRGPVLAQETLAVVGPEQLFPARAAQERVQQFQEHLEARSERDSHLITISFQHPDQALAVQTVRTLITLFRQHLKKLNSGPLALAKQVLQAKRQVVQAETQLAMFSKNMPVADKTYISAQQSALEERLAEAGEKRAQLAENLAGLEQQFALLPAEKEDQQAFLQFKFYEHELLRKYEEHEPLIRSVRQQLADISDRLRSQQTVAQLADQIVAAKAALTAHEEKTAVLVRQLDQEKKHNTTAGQEQARRRLAEQLAAAEHNLSQLLSQLQEAEQAESITTVIEQPLPLLATIRANKLLVFVAAVCFALLCSLLFLLLWQNRPQTAQSAAP